MPNQSVERLAAGSGESLEFQLPDAPFVRLPERFLQRYPEMNQWQTEDRNARQKWKAECELKIRAEFDKVRKSVNDLNAALAV